jgi:hypothetical protein
MIRSVLDPYRVWKWKSKGKPVPAPQSIKTDIIAGYGKRFNITTLVETGTFHGDTLWALRDSFRKLVSIEIDQTLHERAKRRLGRYPNINLVLGDSAKALPAVLAELRGPAVFYLDGHYSGGITGKSDEVSPILRELGYIFKHPENDHVILIDDARLFKREEGYPELADVKAFMVKARPSWTFEVVDDIIRFHRPRKN